MADNQEPLTLWQEAVLMELVVGGMLDFQIVRMKEVTTPSHPKWEAVLRLEELLRQASVILKALVKTEKTS